MRRTRDSLNALRRAGHAVVPPWTLRVYAALADECRDRGGPVSERAVARRAGCCHTNASVCLIHLEAAGLVARGRRSDGRRLHGTVRPAGRVELFPEALTAGVSGGRDRS